MSDTNTLPNFYELQRRYWGNPYAEMSSDDSLDDSAAANNNAPNAAAGVGATSAIDVRGVVHFGEGIDASPYADYAPVANDLAPDIDFSDESSSYANNYVPETDKSAAHDSAANKSKSAAKHTFAKHIAVEHTTVKHTAIKHTIVEHTAGNTNNSAANNNVFSDDEHQDYIYGAAAATTLTATIFANCRCHPHRSWP